MDGLKWFLAQIAHRNLFLNVFMELGLEVEKFPSQIELSKRDFGYKLQTKASIYLSSD